MEQQIHGNKASTQPLTLYNFVLGTQWHVVITKLVRTNVE